MSRFILILTLFFPIFLDGTPQKILIFYTNAGGGHKATAKAIENGLHAHDPTMHINCVNSADVLGFAVEKFCFRSLEDTYTKNLGSSEGRYLNSLLGKILIRPLAKGLNLFSKKMMQYYGSKHPLIQFIDEQKPDVVISTSSFLNAHLSYAIDKTSSSPVFIVLMSDFDEAFDVMWSNGTSSTHYIIKEGAALLNQVNDPNVHKIGSLCVHPKFKSTGFSKKEWKKRLGLNGEMITIFCSFGGYGSFEMLELFDILRKKTNVHPIFITGNNEELYKRLTAQKIDHITVLSFTNHIEDWMRGSDLFVGKPGPGSVYEAIHTGLPLFLRGGIGVLKQEQGVLNWVVNNRFGEEWKDLKEFEIKLDEVIEKLNIYEKNILSSNTPFGTDQAIETILKIFHLRHGEGDGTTK